MLSYNTKERLASYLEAVSENEQKVLLYHF